MTVVAAVCAEAGAASASKERAARGAGEGVGVGVLHVNPQKFIWWGVRRFIRPSAAESAETVARSEQRPLLDAHLVGGGELLAGGERLGPLVAHLRVHRDGRGDLLEGAVRLALGDGG